MTQLVGQPAKYRTTDGARTGDMAVSIASDGGTTVSGTNSNGTTGDGTTDNGTSDSWTPGGWTTSKMDALSRDGHGRDGCSGRYKLAKSDNTLAKK